MKINLIVYEKHSQRLSHGYIVSSHEKLGRERLLIWWLVYVSTYFFGHWNPLQCFLELFICLTDVITQSGLHLTCCPLYSWIFTNAIQIEYWSTPCLRVQEHHPTQLGVNVFSWAVEWGHYLCAVTHFSFALHGFVHRYTASSSPLPDICRFIIAITAPLVAVPPPFHHSGSERQLCIWHHH